MVLLVSLYFFFTTIFYLSISLLFHCANKAHLMQSRIPSCFQQIFRIQFGKLLSSIFCKFFCFEGKPRPEVRTDARGTVIRIRKRHTAIRIRVVARPKDHTGLFFFRHSANLFVCIKVKIRKIPILSFYKPWRPALIHCGGYNA